jgi:hypothetical protein
MLCKFLDIVNIQDVENTAVIICTFHARVHVLLED